MQAIHFRFGGFAMLRGSGHILFPQTATPTAHVQILQSFMKVVPGKHVSFCAVLKVVVNPRSKAIAKVKVKSFILLLKVKSFQ